VQSSCEEKGRRRCLEGVRVAPPVQQTGKRPRGQAPVSGDDLPCPSRVARPDVHGWSGQRIRARSPYRPEQKTESEPPASARDEAPILEAPPELRILPTLFSVLFSCSMSHP